MANTGFKRFHDHRIWSMRAFPTGSYNITVKRSPVGDFSMTLAFADTSADVRVDVGDRTINGVFYYTPGVVTLHATDEEAVRLNSYLSNHLAWLLDVSALTAWRKLLGVKK